jgi:hypothetical protein
MNSNDFAPIALFVYNRPEHTRLTIESLLKNPESSNSSLYIYSDGPKTKADSSAVYEVRNVIKTIRGFSEVNIIERDKNIGLANSIIKGVTQLCTKHGSVIVLEDDLEVSPYFLAYMNDALEEFSNDDRVAAISGYMFPVQHEFGYGVFLRETPLSWGWATWAEQWTMFNPDGKDLLNKLRLKLKLYKFNYAGPQPFTSMLKNQISGRNNSWFIRWCASVFLKEKFTAMPTYSLVRNIGLDGTGTHCASWRYNPYEVSLSKKKIALNLLGLEETGLLERKLKKYFIKIRLLRYVNFIYRFFSRYSSD